MFLRCLAVGGPFFRCSYHFVQVEQPFDVVMSYLLRCSSLFRNSNFRTNHCVVLPFSGGAQTSGAILYLNVPARDFYSFSRFLSIPRILLSGGCLRPTSPHVHFSDVLLYSVLWHSVALLKCGRWAGAGISSFLSGCPAIVARRTLFSLLVCLLVCRGTLKNMHSPLHCVPLVSPLHCGAS